MPSSLRLTFIVTNPWGIERPWTSAADTTKLFFLDSFQALDDMLRKGSELDVERVVLDSGAATASQFLALMAAHPGFSGDFLLVGPGSDGFLSSTGRGGDRVLYALSGEDVGFYLSIHALTEVPRVHQPYESPAWQLSQATAA